MKNIFIQRRKSSEDWQHYRVECAMVIINKLIMNLTVKSRMTFSQFYVSYLIIETLVYTIYLVLLF